MHKGLPSEERIVREMELLARNQGLIFCEKVKKSDSIMFPGNRVWVSIERRQRIMEEI